MAYTAEISRANPSCFVFVIDQSGSMSDPFGGSDNPTSKADALATAINRLLSELVLKCSKNMEVRRYFQVGVIGYGASVGPVLGGSLIGRELVWIDEVYNNPLRVEERIKQVSDGAGGLVETTVKFPVWFDATARDGTPMTHAFSQVLSMLQSWITQYPASFPPVVTHITDGESTDGDPSEVANAVRALATTDGNVLLLNLHLSSTRAPSVQFPDSELGLPDQYARMLFQISSVLPESMRTAAHDQGYGVSENSRGFVFNAGIEDTIRFLTIGTQASNLR